MIKAPNMQTLKTILPVIPPPMPAMSVPCRPALRDHSAEKPMTLTQGPTKPNGLPTKVWKDMRGYHRKPTPGSKK